MKIWIPKIEEKIEDATGSKDELHSEKDLIVSIKNNTPTDAAKMVQLNNNKTVDTIETEQMQQGRSLEVNNSAENDKDCEEVWCGADPKVMKNIIN